MDHIIACTYDKSMQNNPNQKDPDNRGLDEPEIVSEQIHTLGADART
jgi:hypothetical protein